MQKARPTFRSDGVAVAAAGGPAVTQQVSQWNHTDQTAKVGSSWMEERERDFAQFEREGRGIPSSDQKEVPISYYELGTRFIFGG